MTIAEIKNWLKKLNIRQSKDKYNIPYYSKQLLDFIIGCLYLQKKHQEEKP